MTEALLVFDLATAHTRAVVAAVPDLATWDRLPGPGLGSLRAQFRHLALVRESILMCLAGEATAGLGAVFESPAWASGTTAALGEAFDRHAQRCRERLAGLDPQALDQVFTTPFGNRSTPRNYLRMLLLEETHHRAQMTLTLRLLGCEPPAYPGQAWVELGVAQPPM